MDGVHVPANRMALALRSPLLQRMLYGSFAESNSDIVEIGYEGWILRAIVHYCHTDKVVEALGFELDDEIGHDDTVVDERCEERDYFSEAAVCFEKLVSLSVAAEYFELHGLSRLLKESLIHPLEKMPALAIPLLNICRRQGPAVPADIVALTVETLQSKTLASLRYFIALGDIWSKMSPLK